MKRIAQLMMVIGVLLVSMPVFPQAAGSGQDDYQVGDRLPPQAGENTGDFREISWDDLIPSDWLPEDLLEGLFEDADLDNLDDADPRALEFLAKMKALWDSAPVVDNMDGQRIRLPGFVVPLEGDDREIREFLLVPYFGACIHVPPPPANQLIHVLSEKPLQASLNMMPVWVNGTLTIERYDSDMGNAGYRMNAVKVEHYEEEE